MLTVDQAVQAILEHVVPGSTVRLALNDAWLLRLAESITAPHDSPPFDKSLMDGFAVCSRAATQPNQTGSSLMSPEIVASDEPVSQQHQPSIELQVLETVTAGQIPGQTVSSGAAVRIMTGALLPAGADCVVPIENTEFDEAQPQTVRICSSEFKAESCIMRAGTAARAGSRLMEAGQILVAPRIAALAEFGISHVQVYRRPSVAVLATGDELLTADQPLTPGRIRNSNEPMLIAQLKQANAVPVPLGVARDQPEQLAAAIHRGLQHDFLLLTGGVSAGTLDLVPGRLAAAGVQTVFHGISMKPGKPLWFGVFQRDGHRCVVFGLPGNPVSSLACFELFVASAIRRFLGSPNPHPQPVFGALTQAISVRGNRPVYQPVHASFSSQGLQVTPVPWNGSSDLRATIDANAMALLRPETGLYSAGQQVATYFWSGMIPLHSDD